MSTLPALPVTVSRSNRITRLPAVRARRAALRRNRIRQAVASAVGIVATAVAAGVSALVLLTAAAIAESGEPQPAATRPPAVVEAPPADVGILLP